MDTHFATPVRALEDELAAEIDFVSKNPVMSGLLHSISGLLAVLDEHRQVVALNDSFLDMLGIDDSAGALGLRPGEALNCIHAHDEPAGCGTTKFCSTCGAAIAIVSCLEEDAPIEKICSLSVKRGGKTVDIALSVRSSPIILDQRKFILLYLQDITRQQQRAALERTFFHDVNNMLSVLVGASELLMLNDPSNIAKSMHRTSLRLLKEVAIQQCLAESDSYKYDPIWHEFKMGQILEELQAFFAGHPAANEKTVEFPETPPALSIVTDISLLLRVLCNMIINALEATPRMGVVKVWLESDGDFVSFCVWNGQEIQEHVANRIFQRNFSTKGQAGRGVGTYSMKLFGERILDGQVGFTTSAEGTTFRFTAQI